MVQDNTEYRIDGFMGRWGVAERARGYVLMEHTTLGDETCYLVISEKLKPRMVTYQKRNGETVSVPILFPRKVYETYDPSIELTLRTEGII